MSYLKNCKQFLIITVCFGNCRLEENNPGEFEAQEDDVNNNNNESLNGKTKE